MTWARRFKLKNRDRPFDATMIYSQTRGRIVDYLGTHQHLAVDLHCTVDETGALCIRSGEHRFYEGPIAFRFPLALSGVAKVRESWDDEQERFRIEVHVSNPIFGPLFGYRGTFTVAETTLPARRDSARCPTTPRGTAGVDRVSLCPEDLDSSSGPADSA